MYFASTGTGTGPALDQYIAPVLGQYSMPVLGQYWTSTLRQLWPNAGPALAPNTGAVPHASIGPIHSRYAAYVLGQCRLYRPASIGPVLT